MNFIKSAVSALVLLLHAAPAMAAFNNGVETFPGTVKDNATWGQSGNITSAAGFTQNDALFYDDQNMFGSLSYNTRSQTVAWGKSVRATATITDAQTGMGLFLTNNSAGANDFAGSNSAFWAFTVNTNPNSNFNRVVIGSGSNGAWGDGNRGIFAYEPITNHQYVLQITPLSLTIAEFTLFDSDGLMVLESMLYDNAPVNVPNNLHIALVGTGGSATFHSVAIVPEPATAALAFPILLAMAAFRRR